MPYGNIPADTILPTNEASVEKIDFKSDVAVAANELVLMSTYPSAGEVRKAILADASTAATTTGDIYVSDDGFVASTTSTYQASLWKTVSNVNTAASGVDASVYLSDTGGGWSLTPGTFRRVVGKVLVADATAGKILLAPQNVSGLGYGMVWRDSISAQSATVASIAAATAFDKTLTLPGNTWVQGAVLRIQGTARALAQNSTDTQQIIVRIGTDAILTGTAVDIAVNDLYHFDISLTAQAAPGGTAAVDGGGMGGWSTSGTTDVDFAAPGAALTVASNADLTLDVQVAHGSNNAGNQTVLVSFSASVI